MKNTILILALTAVLVGAYSLPSQAAPATNTYAQKLMEQTAAKHPELNIIGLHVTPPNGKDNIIIASSNPTKIGKKSDPDDLDVMKTRKPTVERRDDKKIFDLGMPLYTKSGQIIGTIVMEVKYSFTNEPSVALKRGQAVSDELRAQIPSKAKLFEPAQ